MLQPYLKLQRHIVILHSADYSSTSMVAYPSCDEMNEGNSWEMKDLNGSEVSLKLRSGRRNTEKVVW